MTWRVVFYSGTLEEALHELPDGLLAKLVRCLERMELDGPDLGMPYTRAMGRGLFEIRLSAREGIARVLYCTIVDKQIVLLHYFIKKTQETPVKDLRIARERMAVVENAQHL